MVDASNVGGNVGAESVRSGVSVEGFPCLILVEPDATRDLLDSGVRSLGPHAVVLIDAIKTLQEHLEYIAVFASTDSRNSAVSQLQIVSAFRSLSTLLEIRLKQVTGSTALLHDVIRAGYQKNLAVWARFEAEKKNCGMSSKSATPYATRLRYALTPFSAPSSHKERFAQSLLVTYIVRNYSTHEMDINGPLVAPTSARPILGHFLNVFTYCDVEKSL